MILDDTLVSLPSEPSAAAEMLRAYIARMEAAPENYPAPELSLRLARRKLATIEDRARAAESPAGGPEPGPPS